MNAYVRRNSILLEMGFKNYSQYLRSPLWKGIRAKKLKHDPNCYGCGKKARQVHHSDYSREVLAGETQFGLWSVCKRCHQWSEFTRDGYKRTPKEATDELKRIHFKYVGFESRKVDRHVSGVKKTHSPKARAARSRRVY